ncbi:DUF5337 domain-containing protein [Pacificoceanicola onchidii]|uniref:DUF5337 domain-containing protein n=1 Tax=Pacificoceanicola onchidii TaxID=2562685 RepID=UPI0010A46865|nr:DUF5337 domain-containing protein [Pacificoceanicola onchidii]
MTKATPDQQKTGRRIALLIAGTGVAWIAINALGAAMGWTARTLALFDLAAIAAFGWAIWMIFGLWRARQQQQD